MDLSITLITSETHQDRGAKAYDDGLDVNDHGLPEHSPARKHWQAGWHARRIELKKTVQQLAECPP